VRPFFSVRLSEKQQAEKLRSRNKAANLKNKILSALLKKTSFHRLADKILVIDIFVAFILYKELVNQDGTYFTQGPRLKSHSRKTPTE
jgi:hypothetical protein